MFQVRLFEARTLSWWYSRRDKIDMSPSYQRRSNIWSQYDRAYLIDSILNGFDIPKFYIADFTLTNTSLNKERKPYAIIDGKQRFQAMFEFLEGNLPLNHDFTLFENQSLRLGGLSFKDLEKSYPEVAEVIFNFNPTVMSVITDEEDKINQLFIRLNKFGKKLTGAEIRNAVGGRISELFRALAGHDFFSKKTKFKSDRGENMNGAAKLLLIEISGGFAETKKKTLDRFAEGELLKEKYSTDEIAEIGVELQAEASNPIDVAATRVKQVLDNMVDVFIDADPLLDSQALIPIYYWFVRNHEQYASRIREFLVSFDKSRKESQRLAKLAQPNADIELVNFNVMNRSPDDRLTLVARYNILVTRFARFMNEPISNFVLAPMESP